MTTIYIDADACPVKEEVYRVAERHKLPVKVVANSRMRVPDDARIELVVVPALGDDADDWIVEQCGPGDIIITNDIPLADRALKKGSRALAPTGHVHTPDNIGSTLATRDLMHHLREMGTIDGGGPPPFTKKDRSRFLQNLDEQVRAIVRAGT